MRTTLAALAMALALAAPAAGRAEEQTEQANPAGKSAAEMPQPQWGFVAGQVVDRSGVGLKDVKVELWQGTELVYSTTSGPHGMYEIHMVNPGSYAARLIGPDGRELGSPTLQVNTGTNEMAQLEADRSSAPSRQARTPGRR